MSSLTKDTALICVLIVQTTKFILSRGGRLFFVGKEKDMPEVPQVTERSVVNPRILILLRQSSCVEEAQG